MCSINLDIDCQMVKKCENSQLVIHFWQSMFYTKKLTKSLYLILFKGKNDNYILTLKPQFL